MGLNFKGVNLELSRRELKDSDFICPYCNAPLGVEYPKKAGGVVPCPGCFNDVVVISKTVHKGYKTGE